jgi:hypothetical protein
MDMRKFALATAAAAALLFTAPSFTGVTAPAEAATTVVKKKVVVKHGDRDHMRKKVVVRHGDRGLHRGWSHSRHYGANKKVVVIKKKGNGNTVVKKKITHG